MEHLTTLIHEYGLSAHQNDIVSSVRPAIFLRLGAAEPGQTGQSRIGGDPDLPVSLPWPKSALLDTYLSFILQINLAEAPTFQGSPLGTAGMLYLFADEAEDSAEQVVLYAGNEPLQPARLPEDASSTLDWYEHLVAHRLAFELAADIPRWATEDYRALAERLGMDGEEKLGDVGTALSKDTVGKLLGHASGIGHDPREDAYVVREVNPEWLYNYKQRGALDMSRAKNWHNLLEVDSSRAVGLMFGDAGYLQVLIHGEDLQRRDFSRVYVNLESS